MMFILGLCIGGVLGLFAGWLMWGWKPWDEPPIEKPKKTAGDTLAEKYRNPQPRPNRTLGRGGE